MVRRQQADPDGAVAGSDAASGTTDAGAASSRDELTREAMEAAAHERAAMARERASFMDAMALGRFCLTMSCTSVVFVSRALPRARARRLG